MLPENHLPTQNKLLCPRKSSHQRQSSQGGCAVNSITSDWTQVLCSIALGTGVFLICKDDLIREPEEVIEGGCVVIAVAAVVVAVIFVVVVVVVAVVDVSVVVVGGESSSVDWLYL